MESEAMLWLTLPNFTELAPVRVTVAVPVARVELMFVVPAVEAR